MKDERGGLDAVRAPRHDRPSAPPPTRRLNGGGRPLALVLGGAGFIGTNLTARLVCEGFRVRVLDDLSRPSSGRNLQWLQERFGGAVEHVRADVRDAATVDAAVGGAQRVFHLAAQVAVTTSLRDPRADFEVNVGGTFHLLEALRRLRHPPPLLFTSTNKVYGNLGTVALAARATRYAPLEPAVRRRGVGETQPIDFHTPYGCSKGAADQYVLDYARCFSLPAAVFRMSCIYGPHQNGSEDQGWVAHLTDRYLHDQPIRLYGDGKQVRDLLYVDDLVDAMMRFAELAPSLAGRAYNIGGGPRNACSLLELLALLEKLGGRPARVVRDAWRPADQQYYVSDTSRFRASTGWTPRVRVRTGVARLYGWLRDQRERARPLGRRLDVARPTAAGRAAGRAE